jgi:hypothetical protein
MSEAKQKSVSAEKMLPQLDPRVPPMFVRRKKDGMVTGWSTIFRKNLDDFEIYYRPGTDDALAHAIKMRRYEAKMALEGGDPYAGGSRGFSMMVGEVVDAEYSSNNG